MAIYINTLPYMVRQIKKVVFPRTTSIGKRNGYGNLVFLFTDDVNKSIKMADKKADSPYRFYYNLHYRGSINKRIYNIKDLNERKRVYEKVVKETQLTPQPLSQLKNLPNRNCYYDLSKYFQIYLYMTKKFAPVKKVNIFWSFFKSIFFSEDTMKFDNRYILIDASMFGKFRGKLSDCLDDPLFMIYYTLYKYPDMITDMNIDFVFYSNNSVLKMNPSMCDKKSYLVFKRELAKLHPLSGVDKISEQEIDEESRKEDIKDSIKDKYNFVGDPDDVSEVTNINIEVTNSEKDETIEKINKKIDKKVEEVQSKVKTIVDTSSPEVDDYVKTQVEIDLEDDKELIEDMYKVMKSTKVPATPLSTARDREMRKKQESLVVNNISFSKLDKMKASSRKIPERNISSSLHNINKNTATVKFSNMNKDYIENVLPEDVFKTFTSLNNKSSKFYVKNVEVKETSDTLNYKDTYRVIIEDEKKQQHIVTVDIPKFLDNKFLYLGGNKKIINKQNFLYPVVKTAPDTVQIVSNYKKMFIRRIGTKSISSVERIMKLINSNDEFQKYFTVGNNSSSNKTYITTIEYDEFGKVLTQFKNDKCTIFFSQKDAHDYAEENNIVIPDGNMFIGVKDKKNIFIDTETHVTKDGKYISDILISELPEELQKEFNRTRNTKKLIYNTVTIMSQTIPFIVLLLYWEGITSVFNKMKLKYRFTTKYPSEVKVNENVIRFKDCFLVYEDNITIGLLMNGIQVLDTENHSIDEYNTSEPFMEYFKKVYGKIAILNAISNFYEFMLDPITLEILEDIDLPTDLIELCIYASNLLADESYTIENSQVLSRIRSTEIIPAILYNELSTAYLAYKNSGGKKKMSVARDCVIKQLLALQTVEDYSTLNPKLQWGII